MGVNRSANLPLFWQWFSIQNQHVYVSMILGSEVYPGFNPDSFGEKWAKLQSGDVDL